jgi:hypothetical protein
MPGDVREGATRLHVHQVHGDGALTIDQAHVAAAVAAAGAGE